MHPKIDLKQLPPLKALKGFEAATRHQSIRDAADELCLTHPAVSHQVQLIEDALGVTLFVQEGRHIVSTEEGKVLYPYVRAAFE
jgi:LysR family glycine cleavage system transcriptional activator